MIDLSPEFEPVVLMYINKYPTYYRNVEKDFFIDDYVRILFDTSKAFHKKYSVQLFDPEKPSLTQLWSVVKENPSAYLITDDPNATDKREILKNFMDVARNIVNTDLKLYSDKYLSETVQSWILWKNSMHGYDLSTQYIKSQKLTTDNVRNVICKSREIMMKHNSITFGEQQVFDFWDADSHILPDPSESVSTGYPVMNLALTENEAYGFTKGTLTIFVGPPNSGKSIVLGNIALNASLSGSNVCLVTLEMSVQKIYKRIWCSLFDTKMHEYPTNEPIIGDKLKGYVAQHPNVGKFFGIRFSKGTPSETMAKIKEIENENGIAFDMIVIDYLTELGNDHGISAENMYSFHKSNADDLFRISVDFNYAVVTAHQAHVKNAGESNVYMNSYLSESSGLLHRADNVIAMIQTELMKMNNEMWFKYLKLRDSKYRDYFTQFKIDYSKMLLYGTDQYPIPNSEYIA